MRFKASTNIPPQRTVQDPVGAELPSAALSLAHETGLEPAHIRFFETSFPEHFGPVASLTSTVSQQSELALRVHRMIFDEDRSVAFVRRMLEDSRLARTKPLRLIAVASGKGGVGKTTLSTNLAAAMVAQGERVLIFDADLGLGNVHITTGVQPALTIADVVDRGMSLEEAVSAGPNGLFVLAGGSGSARLADLDAAAVARLASDLTRLGELVDVVVIDCAAGISSQVLSFLKVAHDIITVATPNLASTLDAYGLIKAARENQVQGDVSVIVNQARNREQALAVYEKLKACSSRFLDYAPNYLGYLNRETIVERAYQQRCPLVQLEPHCSFSKRVNQMAEKLRQPDKGNGS